MQGAESKIRELETGSSEWKKYQHSDAMVEESLNLVQNVNAPLLNLFNVKNLIASCDFNLRNLEAKESELEQLNLYAEKVMAKADPSTRQVVANHHKELTQRYHILAHLEASQVDCRFLTIETLFQVF